LKRKVLSAVAAVAIVILATTAFYAGESSMASRSTTVTVTSTTSTPALEFNITNLLVRHYGHDVTLSLLFTEEFRNMTSGNFSYGNKLVHYFHESGIFLDTMDVSFTANQTQVRAYPPTILIVITDRSNITLLALFDNPGEPSVFFTSEGAGMLAAFVYSASSPGDHFFTELRLQPCGPLRGAVILTSCYNESVVSFFLVTSPNP
jgi:hypothetical protein